MSRITKTYKVTPFSKALYEALFLLYKRNVLMDGLIYDYFSLDIKAHPDITRAESFENIQDQFRNIYQKPKDKINEKRIIELKEIFKKYPYAESPRVRLNVRIKKTAIKKTMDHKKKYKFELIGEVVDSYIQSGIKLMEDDLYEVFKYSFIKHLEDVKKT